MLYIYFAFFIRSRSGNKFPSVHILAFNITARHKKRERKKREKVRKNIEINA